jgi:hypothetical protein
MKKKLRSLYTDPLYRNSLALMLNSAVGAFFVLLFWIVAARTMPAKEKVSQLQRSGQPR